MLTRSPRQIDKLYLETVRRLPCVICGFWDEEYPCHAAHIRYADDHACKPITGMGQKPDDRWTLPLCPDRFDHKGCHMRQHSYGDERAWWREQRLDPIRICQELWDAYNAGPTKGRLERMQNVIFSQWWRA